jgi:hypothetical protein
MITPTTNYTSQRLRETKKIRFTPRINLEPVDPHGLEIDCVVEAKAKELAVIQLVTGRNMSAFYDEQRGTTDEKLNEIARKDKEKKAAERLAKKRAA